MSPNPKLIAGNWKMNGLTPALAEIRSIVEGAGTLDSAVSLAICPPATLLGAVTAVTADSPVETGGQDCHANASGAHTGDISAEMLADTGARYVIVGHSERRSDHGETDANVAAKAEAAFRAKLVPIICVGEDLDQRDAGKAVDIVSEQLAKSVPETAATREFVIAYEPVWAIGTGRTPTVEQVEEVHDCIRSGLIERFGEGQGATRLLYGGSVKPANAAELMNARNVDGALVGGASLKAEDFLAIARNSA